MTDRLAQRMHERARVRSEAWIGALEAVGRRFGEALSADFQQLLNAAKTPPVPPKPEDK